MLLVSFKWLISLAFITFWYDTRLAVILMCSPMRVEPRKAASDHWVLQHLGECLQVGAQD